MWSTNYLAMHYRTCFRYGYPKHTDYQSFLLNAFTVIGNIETLPYSTCVCWTIQGRVPDFRNKAKILDRLKF